MTITRNDLKIFKPELLGSSDDAGGQRTKNEVKSGQLNELFRAISDIDHAQSAVDIVKCYPALNTADTSILLDGHVFISQKPSDPLVSMLIAESDDLGDADRMTDMVEILESSVKAGQLIRNRLIGLLAGQDSFPRSYLQSIYQFNGKEYYETVTLRQGQTIVISVEYSGNENASWPRFEHFCEIQKTVSGGQGGQVSFKPPIPYDTPNYDVVINGETGCTKLRYVSDNDGIKYHGVSELTVENTDNTLKVESTHTELLPKIKSVNPTGGNKLPGVEDNLGGTAGGATALPSMVYKNVFLPSVSGQSTYVFELPDLLVDPWLDENGIKNAQYTGGYAFNASVTIVGTTVTVTFNGQSPSGNSPIGLSYLSIDKWSVWQSPSPFLSDRILVLGKTYGVITFNNATYGTSVISTSTAQPTDLTAVPLLETNNNRIATINATTGVITKEIDFRGDFTVEIGSLLQETESGGVITPGDTSVVFNLPFDEPILDTLYIQVSTTNEVLLSGSSDQAGVITGNGVSGNVVNGIVTLSFSSAVWLSTLTYDISEVVTLSPPPELYGLNPLRIKNGGLVESFTAWNTISIQHTQTQVVVNPAPAQTYTVRANARFVDITDADGKSLWTVTDEHYSLNKATGEVTINSVFTGFTAPFLLTNSIGETALVTDVQPNKLVLAAALSQTFPIGSVVSSIQNLGDMQARVGTVRDMTSWNNNWDLDGTPATASMNVVDYPIEVVNDTAINEDWVLIFTSSTAFRCVGRRIGQVATGDTINDFAPINPLTLAPYFIIRNEAFGGGWNVGEAVRFKTYASANPIMMLRTVQSGHSQITTDRAVLSFRGNES
ncbi:hypothetical protein [Shewanella subflava]|uniref:Coil containing protein n=1 Tax=Shewanella subflava TaxID=2986476 RepID=A0ABT3I5T8_9GAMM|nr:hypothetical protein [Shewanella subflava]MCW3171435.1 hypothetical protein [Shewanella subflava]